MSVHFNKVKSLYKKSESSDNLVKSPIEVVQTMIKELKKSMETVASATNIEKKRSDRAKHFSRALVIIYTLQTSLDFEKGGKLATELFQIYEYCRQQLIKGFQKKIVDGIQKAVKALNDIFDFETDVINNV